MDKLRLASQVVQTLFVAVNTGEARLEAVPGLVKRVIKENLWHERYIPRSSSVERYSTFVEFVDKALHTKLEALKDLCRKDTEALDAIDRVTANPKHIHINADDNNVNISTREVGNSEVYALRRLRKARPDLHEKVIAGELSPHAAMVKAGFRKKTFTVQADPAAAAKAIRRHFSDEQVRELASRLTLDD